MIDIGSAPFSCVATSISSPFQPNRRYPQLTLSRGLYNRQHYDVQHLSIEKAKSHRSILEVLKLKGRFMRRQFVPFATNEDQSKYNDPEPDDLEEENDDYNAEDFSPTSSASVHFEGSNGKPGFISFYRRPYKRDDEILISHPKRNDNDLLWFIGPAVLVASFIFPSLYLRSMISTIFEDSLVTDFLILFFTEAVFYGGVAIYLLLIDHLRRSTQQDSCAISNRTKAPQLGQRISSVTVLALSLTIPMVTMGLVWPWTGPAASATLAPYLVGIVVQFAFEQYARYKKSPSLPVIPVIFQVYRLHQLNRAAQLVTALSFRAIGAEMTAHNLAINNSLGTLLSVLKCLGVICIWSLSSFLMRFIPSAAMTEREA